MAGIVGIHGIAQQFGGGFQLGHVWFNALRDGLTAAGYRSKADALAADDSRVVFFGDLFRPPGALAGQQPPYSAADIEPGLEADLLAEWYQAAVAQDPTLGPPPGALGRGKVAAQVMLERLLRSRTFARVAQRGLIGNLKQVTWFLTDHSVKETVLSRVHQEVGQDTQVLIGHSLGSVVAYEYLCRYQPPSVGLLVTLGSPLGIPNLVFERLTPAPVMGAGAWPDGLADWVNVADPDDIVALRKELAGVFPGRAPDVAVDDRAVDNGDEPHAVDRYLNATQTGSAIGNVLP